MAGSISVRSSPTVGRLALGFVAGFLATVTFHQIGFEILHLIGLTPASPYNMHPVPPFGVPQVVSLSFWAGIWGILFVAVTPYLERCPGGYWVGAILFGAIFPTAVGWFVVLPLKGLPAGYGFHFPGILVGPIVNGLWGLGTAVFLSLVPPSPRRRFGTSS